MEFTKEEKIKFLNDLIKENIGNAKGSFPYTKNESLDYTNKYVLSLYKQNDMILEIIKDVEKSWDEIKKGNNGK